MIEYGLIGEKLGHSFSKEIHDLIGKYDYSLLEITSKRLEQFLTEKKFKAVNVTIPYKHSVMPFLDEISEAAESIGAVNCIRNDSGRLVGHNTDFDGLKALLDHAGIKVCGKKALILGTGGTSDTALAVLKSQGAAEVFKVSRSPQKVSGITPVITYDEAVNLHGDAGIIINTTPAGMYPNIFDRALDLSGFQNLEGVVDVVYNPLTTALVKQACDMGVKAEGGLYMLVAQAVKAAEFFLSEKKSLPAAEDIYNKIYKGKLNIVLTGMPSCGKSTIGRIVADELGSELIDTDSLIEQEQGMTISEIFERYGEQCFRDKEAEAIREVAAQSGIVIATGGGAVLRHENMENLKRNGKIFFIDRAPDMLSPTPDRPVAFNREEIEKRYKERYGTYVSAADCIIDNSGTARQAADKILEEFR